jgi:hypothetical protein
VTITLGTGTGLPPSNRRRTPLHDHSCGRSLTAIENQFDGERSHQDMRISLGEDKTKNIHRLQVQLNNLPRLDDIRHFDFLKKHVEETQSPDEITKQAFALLAATLYFTLDIRPQRTGSGSYYCRATIRCRLAGHTFWRAMQRVKAPLLLIKWDDDRICELTPQNSICPMCHRFRSHLSFRIPHLDQPVNFQIGGEDDTDRVSLGAFPRPMAWFVKQQGFDAVFGEFHHGRPQQFWCDACAGQPVNPRKRASSRPSGPWKRSKPLPALP